MNNFDYFDGTIVYDILSGLDGIYNEIEESQKRWMKSSPASCYDGCGHCCESFEPDLLECEALYLGAWLIFNKPQVADSLVDGTFLQARKINDKTCILFDPDNDHHCTVYNGRALICRLFGYSGDLNKSGKIRWRACKFIAANDLKNGIEHRDYSEEELKELVNDLPPVMAYFMMQAMALEPSNVGNTESLRIALPKAIEKLKIIMNFLGSPNPNSPKPNSPDPLPSQAA